MIQWLLLRWWMNCTTAAMVFIDRLLSKQHSVAWSFLEGFHWEKLYLICKLVTYRHIERRYELLLTRCFHWEGHPVGQVRGVHHGLHNGSHLITVGSFNDWLHVHLSHFGRWIRHSRYEKVMLYRQSYREMHFTSCLLRKDAFFESFHIVFCQFILVLTIPSKYSEYFVRIIIWCKLQAHLQLFLQLYQDVTALVAHFHVRDLLDDLPSSHNLDGGKSVHCFRKLRHASTVWRRPSLESMITYSIYCQSKALEYLAINC